MGWYQILTAYSFPVLTAIPYRASTGPEQGFPCVAFPHREKPVFIAGFLVDGDRFFPVGNTTQGKPCFRYMDGFAVHNDRVYYIQLVAYIKAYVTWELHYTRHCIRNKTFLFVKIES